MAVDVPEYEIRQMRKEEIPEVLELWRETNLSEGTHSLESWYEYDPEGFYVAVTNDGRVIGSCAGILQHDDLAFIGLYVVTSALQGRGIGRKMWDKVMERVGDRNAGVNPVPKQLANYRDKGGFPIQSDVCCVVCTAQEVLTSQMVTEISGVQARLVSPQDSNVIEEISEYDADVMGFSRERLIPILCGEKDTATVVAIKQQDNSVCGYGIIRENIKGGALVGPLLADNDHIAEFILYNLIEAYPIAKTQEVRVMTIDCNQSAVNMVENLGFEKEPGTARLYRREEVDVQFNKVFGQLNLNFSVF